MSSVCCIFILQFIYRLPLPSIEDRFNILLQFSLAILLTTGCPGVGGLSSPSLPEDISSAPPKRSMVPLLSSKKEKKMLSINIYNNDSSKLSLQHIPKVSRPSTQKPLKHNSEPGSQRSDKNVCGEGRGQIQWRAKLHGRHSFLPSLTTSLFFHFPLFPRSPKISSYNLDTQIWGLSTLHRPILYRVPQVLKLQVHVYPGRPPLKQNFTQV